MNLNDQETGATADRELVITRSYDAPAHLLFRAWSQPEHIMRWFGPEGWPVTHCEMDFRVGGTYRFAMTGPDGEQGTPFGGTYLEIVPNEKIVYDDAFESPGAERMVMTVTFEESGGQTTLTVHTLFPSVAMKDKHLEMGMEEGLGMSLDQLGDLVTDMQAGRA
jgi:uncharacterized protein YndB with AHSA1/START domain